MPLIIDAALNAALDYVRTNATILHICSAEPTSYANVAAVSLGSKTTPSIAVTADRTGGGRQITVAAVADGAVSATGTAAAWAIVSGTELLASGALGASQGVTSGNTFTLTSFQIGIPDAV